MITTPFEHSPLDPADPRAIQILELLPSPDLEGPIRCELHHHSLDEKIKYEALSYCWGVPEPGHTVYVNGPYTLDVTPNCLEALACLRQRSRRRRLWIDAICIDQRDNDISKRERDRQVKIMGDIYHEAQKVLIWLGPEEASTARTMARLKMIAKVNAISKSTRVGSSALNTLAEYLSNFMNAEFDSSIAPPRKRYRAFGSMIHNPWWFRVWTFQEQVLAKHCDVFQGRHSVSLSSLQTDQLKNMIDHLTASHWQGNYETRRHIHKHCQLVDAFRTGSRNRHVSRRDINFSATYMLEVAFSLDSKQAIDKIYGLYSILTTYCRLPLAAPDYNKTAEDVYEETVSAWIGTRRDLSVLKLAGRPFFSPRLPSWVPAWNGQHPRFIRNPGYDVLESELGLRNSHFDWNYSRGKHSSVAEIRSAKGLNSVADVLSPGKLRVYRARFVGRVSHAVGPDRPTHFGYSQDYDFFSLHLSWCRLIHDVFDHDFAEREEALYEMFRSIGYPGVHKLKFRNQKHRENLFELFRAWFDFVMYLNHASRPINARFLEGPHVDCHRKERLYRDVCWAKNEEEAAILLAHHYSGYAQGMEALTTLAGKIRYIKDVLVLSRNHRLCILDNHNMITVTDCWCQEGDEVFVFPRTDSPFVLRKQPDGDCYRLVGPALVDRLLRVGYQKWRSEGDDLQDIVLI